jgi:Holliday junction resolvase RusA-like endonuclease
VREGGGDAVRISFTIPGAPQSKGRPRFARVGKFVRTYTPEKTAAAEHTLVARAMEFRPEKPFGCPLRLSVQFMMPIPESWPKKRKFLAEAGAMPHVGKPDLDNLIKLLKDALNGVFWIDDKQVFSIQASKYYGPVPETIIDLWDRDDDGVPF